MRLAWAAVKEPEELKHDTWANLCEHVLDSCLEITGEIYTIDLAAPLIDTIHCTICKAKQSTYNLKIISGPGAGKFTPINIIDIDEGRYDPDNRPVHYRERLHQATCI